MDSLDRLNLLMAVAGVMATPEWRVDPDAAARLWDLSVAATGATPIVR